MTLFGQNTRAIADSDAWLKSLDGIGMITARGILIEAFSVLQNIAMSFTLDVDPIDPRVVPQAGALARDVGIAAGAVRSARPARPGPKSRCACIWRARSRWGRRLLIGEHPSAALPRETVAAFGADLARVAQARGLALIVITADDALAKAIGGQRLELIPATGELRPPGLLKKLFPSTRSRPWS